ncbi:uncharacterized protein PV09_09020 [Verruconis gallopava]|uniref:Amino acid transporter transmembrane domain-containing protein n=1 Tax=Verruconis gallopava TaxID=253628 RepID=A0A0D2AJX0_9PEZI|nr:uncharacterized protein PV09_09020 [Verruconis gallopava]KIV99248.1 hypothetical protein PV09_09020 [Verruconis gallopava]
MSQNKKAAQVARKEVSNDAEEAQSLLSGSADSEDSELVVVAKADSKSPSRRPSPLVQTQRRQSSLAQPRPDGTPRTPNRVQFDDSPTVRTLSPRQSLQSNASQAWMDEQDYMGHDAAGRVQRRPLLEGIEAPSVTVASDLNLDDLLENARPKSGMRSAFMNMANSIIGAGIIGQPYALRQAGMFAGIFLLVVLTVIVDWTIQLIVINSKLSGANSFQTTVQHCYGRPGLIAISLAQWAFAFGGMLAFCIIIGDTIPNVLRGFFPQLEEMPFLWLLTDRRAVIVLFVLGISYPLSLYRDIAKLAKASALALVSMLVILITIITQGYRVPPESRGQLKGSLLINSGLFQAIGVISFAFVCHHNSLLIYGSLKKPTLDRFAKVTHFSTGVSMLACLIMAMAGFLTFGSKTLGNVLNNFPRDNIMVNIARLCFGLNMLTTLPLECFVCREVMMNYWFPEEPFDYAKHMIFTTSLVVTAMTLSLFTCDLGGVFELIGATSACALAYILPPLCYIKLSSRSWKTGLAFVCVGFGFIVMGITVFQALVKIIRGDGEVKTCS